MVNLNRYAFLFFALLLMISAGCGGGGGSDDELVSDDVVTEDDTVADNSVETSINSSNVKEIYAIVLKSRRFVNLSTGIPYNGIWDIIDTWEVGHTITFAWNEVTYNNLDIDGSVAMTLSQISDSFNGIPPYYIAFELNIIDFSISDDSYNVTGNGDVFMRISNAGQGSTIASLSGERIVLESSGEVDTLTDYFYIFTFYSNDDFEDFLVGDLEIAGFNDVFSFTCDVPFTGNSNVSLGNPTAGELHVSARGDNSQAYIVAQPDGINVQIGIDINGDNSVENTVMTTWSELYELRASKTEKGNNAERSQYPLVDMFTTIIPY